MTMPITRSEYDDFMAQNQNQPRPRPGTLGPWIDQPFPLIFPGGPDQGIPMRGPGAGGGGGPPLASNPLEAGGGSGGGLGNFARRRVGQAIMGEGNGGGPSNLPSDLPPAGQPWAPGAVRPEWMP